MTRERAKELLPIMTAYAEGKRIEFMGLPGSWCDWVDELKFDSPASCYRIAPEPKLRPWTAEEVPVGALVRARGGKVRAVITSFDPESSYPIQAHPWEGQRDWFCEHMEHSTDGGKTWLPCGVLEGEK